MTQRHILLVDDDDDDRLMFSQVIRIIMHQKLTVARDGTEAVKLASDHNFDLVVLDLRLPDLNGWDVAEALRQMKHYRRVPIIAVTAYDLAHTREQSFQAGCDAYVVKPIDVDEFVRVLGDHLAAVA
jgi:CheY-like chemotaxis protein